MIAAIALVAEQRIREAMERGEFDELPSKGRPLDLDEDANVPDDLKMAYKLLKNGGYLDGSTQAGDALSLDAMLRSNPEERAKHRQMLKLQVMEARARTQGGKSLSLECAGESGGEYFEKVVERVRVRAKGEKP